MQASSRSNFWGKALIWTRAISAAILITAVLIWIFAR
jgi:hypothetical protein